VASFFIWDQEATPAAISCFGAFQPPAAAARVEIIVAGGRKPAQYLNPPF
jgi:hypothetical protein